MKLSFSRLENHGRLGNQLFQIMSTMGMAEKHGALAVFPEWSYQKYFDPELPHGDMPGDVVQERNFHYYDWGLTADADLLGYMQSEKYFGSFRLKFKDTFLAETRDQAGDLLDRETICIHIRRGDYVGNKNYYQLPVTYFIDSLLTHFPNWKDYNILFISDDIEYCRNHFECIENSYFSAGNDDIHDMTLASLCDHFILSNSSFGWWCAWLGEKKHSRIVHPGHMYAGRLLQKNDTRDYWPARWTRNQKEIYKVPLQDVTFTIPVLFDHSDRKENFELSLYMLQSNLDTNYIVCEQGGSVFEYSSQWVKYMQSDSKVFHRTKMLNDMAGVAETPYIVNWDCDVIIPPMQLYVAVDKLRSGADAVFPYDGRFCRMRRNEWMEKIKSSKDIGIVRDEKFKGREIYNSVGGAVMFNRDSFIDGGMENENMISFGPEDCERNDRFKMLGYDVQMTRGSLFHMNHHVGVDSSPRNPYFDANHREIEKIRAMNREELRQYVDTWPWRNQYTSVYYVEISEGAIRSAKIVFSELEMTGLNPDSVIDIGCGVGEWNNGHSNYTGVDYRVPAKDLLIPASRYIDCDLNREAVSTPRQYDLCLCLEVAEHIRPHRAPELINMLCRLSNRVLFSAAIPFQGGQGHVNEQWQSWWAGLFRDNGFGPSHKQPNIRNNPDVELWYRQNMVLYVRGGKGEVEDYVLPEYYEQIVRHLHGRLK